MYQFAFRRVGAMPYISNSESEVEYLKRSFQTLEVYFVAIALLPRVFGIAYLIAFPANFLNRYSVLSVWN